MRLALSTLSLLSLFAASSVSAKSCDPILADMSFCPNGVWERMEIDLPDGVFLWRNGPTIAKAIVEAHTSGSAPDAEVVMEAIKDSVRGSLADPETVTFTEHYVQEEEMIDRGIIGYDLSIKGNEISLHHSFMLADQVVIQFVTHRAGGDHLDNLLAHRNFIRSFEIDKPKLEARATGTTKADIIPTSTVGIP